MEGFLFITIAVAFFTFGDISRGCAFSVRLREKTQDISVSEGEGCPLSELFHIAFAPVRVNIKIRRAEKVLHHLFVFWVTPYREETRHPGEYREMEELLLSRFGEVPAYIDHEMGSEPVFLIDLGVMKEEVLCL